MTAGFWIGVALGVGGTVVFLIVVASYLFLVTEEEPTRVDWNPTQIGSVDATISDKGWIPAASARGQWLEMQRTKLNRALAETRKALANSMESHRKLVVWPESCLDWPESALDEIGKMKETACEQWLEDERLLKGEQS